MTAGIVKRTERGWLPRSCVAHYCEFKRHTILELGDLRYAVVTAGSYYDAYRDLKPWKRNAYYATDVYDAILRDGMWIAGIKEYTIVGANQIEAPNQDRLADPMHEAAVALVENSMLLGLTLHLK